ncbi:MAG: PDZ domain-containing protein [Erythrobacter sp.]
MRILFAFLLFALGDAASVAARDRESQTVEVFDAASAWEEFETVLRGKYAYFERDDIDVEAQLDRSRALAIDAEDKAEFRRIIHQTALTFMDPHLIAGPFVDDDYAIIMTAADLSARFVDDVARVEDVRRGSPAFEAGLRPGDRIISIDGMEARAAAMLPFGNVLREATAAQREYGLTLAVNGKRASGRTLEVASADGMVRTVELVSTREYARMLEDRPPLELTFVGSDGDIALITVLNSLGNNDTITAFDEAVERAAGARAFILDLRDTPSGGNTEVARSIIGHFTPEIRPYQMHVIPALEREFSVPRRFVEYVYPRQPFFGGPVVVLHGKWTGSMGEGIVIGMDAASEAVTIGSDMGDLLGGLWNWTLTKSHVHMAFGGEALFHVDGTPREDFTADMPMMPASTAADGTDPALSEAIRIIEGKANANPSR